MCDTSQEQDDCEFSFVKHMPQVGTDPDQSYYLHFNKRQIIIIIIWQSEYLSWFSSWTRCCLVLATDWAFPLQNINIQTLLFAR